MSREDIVFEYLKAKDIPYECYHHPEGKTIAEAMQYWHDDGSVHCKNLFFRNHKGNRHYLVCFHAEQSLAIHDLEHLLRQGRLSGTGRPHNRQIIPFFHGQIDISQYPYRFTALLIIFQH